MKCVICNEKEASEILKVCPDCLREGLGLEYVKKAHKFSKSLFGFKYDFDEGIKCDLCPFECRIPEDSYGFCGLVKNENEKIVRYNLAGSGILEWYHDPLPTNCVASSVCEECKLGLGYNLAIFYIGCNLDCLFCQNWQWREMIKNKEKYRKEYSEILDKIYDDVRCICFFGGDPSVQIPNSILISKLALKKKKLGICYETNGNIRKDFLKKVLEICMESNGYFKIDFKAFDENIYFALTGRTNKYLFENFKVIKKYLPDLNLVVSVLLVPYYIDSNEIQNICKFVYSLDENIPLVFLAFHPDYLMKDLPCTSLNHAKLALKIAKEEGLKNVYLENRWLLQNKINYEV